MAHGITMTATGPGDPGPCREEPAIPPVTDPLAIEHPTLREFAMAAVWVAKLEDAVEALENLVDLLDPRADADGDEPGEERTIGDDVDKVDDLLEVALSVVTVAREEADAALEARLVAWLPAAPEHSAIFRLALFDAWRDERGGLDPTVLGWVRGLTTNAALAHFQQDPYGRRREIDLG